MAIAHSALAALPFVRLDKDGGADFWNVKGVQFGKSAPYGSAHDFGMQSALDFLAAVFDGTRDQDQRSFDIEHLLSEMGRKHSLSEFQASIGVMRVIAALAEHAYRTAPDLVEQIRQKVQSKGAEAYATAKIIPLRRGR